ncbi:MAG: hypothetical protein KAS36_09520, partial [Anaerolineales bacterium]|nr:hypothetical protein [Anaerolineales bacterium]
MPNPLDRINAYFGDYEDDYGDDIFTRIQAYEEQARAAGLRPVYNAPMGNEGNTGWATNAFGEALTRAGGDPSRINVGYATQAQYDMARSDAIAEEQRRGQTVNPTAYQYTKWGEGGMQWGGIRPPAAPRAEDVIRGQLLQQPGDMLPVQATATNAPEPIRFQEQWRSQALETAQNAALNYLPDANLLGGAPAQITGMETQGARREFSLANPRTGEVMMTRSQVNTARDISGSILRQASGSLEGHTGGLHDPDKAIANFKRDAQKGINTWFQGKSEALNKAFSDDPEGLAQAKTAAQNMRNVIFRAANSAIKDMAKEMGGGNFRDFAGAQRLGSVDELRQLSETNPAIAAEIQQTYGSLGAFVGGGGGYLGAGGGQGYVYGDEWGGGGGRRGGGGGRGGMWGGGMGAAMYGMYIGQRLWGYTGGAVLERGAAYGGMVGEMGAGLPFGPGGFAARAALSQMQGGRGAYPYAGAAQGLGMMINERMPGAMAATGMVAGLGAMTNLGANLAMQMGGEGMLGTIGGKVAGVLGKAAAPIGMYMAGVNLFNLFGGEKLLGRQADLLDPFRAIAAAGVQTSELYQQDPTEWARQNAGLATFITSAESGLTPQQERIQDVAGRNAALWGMEPTAIAASYIGFDRAGLFPSQRTVPETGYRSRRARAGGMGGRVGGATDEYISTTMQADESYMSEYRNRAADMKLELPELQQMEFEIAAQFGAPGTEAFRTAMTRMGKLRSIQEYGDVRRQGGRFAQVAGMVQPYQDINRT